MTWIPCSRYILFAERRDRHKQGEGLADLETATEPFVFRAEGWIGEQHVAVRYRNQRVEEVEAAVDVGGSDGEAAFLKFCDKQSLAGGAFPDFPRGRDVGGDAADGKRGVLGLEYIGSPRRFRRHLRRRGLGAGFHSSCPAGKIQGCCQLDFGNRLIERSEAFEDVLLVGASECTGVALVESRDAGAHPMLLAVALRQDDFASGRAGFFIPPGAVEPKF